MYVVKCLKNHEFKYRFVWLFVVVIHQVKLIQLTQTRYILNNLKDFYKYILVSCIPHLTQKTLKYFTRNRLFFCDFNNETSTYKISIRNIKSQNLAIKISWLNNVYYYCRGLLMSSLSSTLTARVQYIFAKVYHLDLKIFVLAKKSFAQPKFGT